MESNFISRYNKKCHEYENQLEQYKDLPEFDNTEQEYMKYQMACMPFILRTQKGETFENSRKKIVLSDVFNKKKQESSEEHKLFHEYMKEVEGIHLTSIGVTPTVKKCPGCQSSNIAKSREVNLSCMDCGFVIQGYEIEDKPSFKDMERISHNAVAFTYKRENHFNEWLDSLEARGKDDISNEAMDQVRYELKKQRFNDPSKITAVVIRNILKKLKYNNHYDNIPMIISAVVGRPPLVIKEELRRHLKKMFSQVQKIYHKHVPKHRSNFFSYPYILYKFCELLEADHVLPYLTLLKSAEKLYQQDQTFKKICEELKWEFIKTI